MTDFNYFEERFRTRRLQKAYKLQGSMQFQGLSIKIENRIGSIRRWKAEDGTSGETKMHTRYGYISKTLGADGDAVDVYVSDINPKSDKVFVIHQKFPDTGEYDEDKCMLGFNTEEEATAEYYRHYDSKDFFDSVETFTIDEFKEALKDLRGHKLTKSSIAKAFDLITQKQNDAYILDAQGNPILSKASTMNAILSYSGLVKTPRAPKRKKSDILLVGNLSKADIAKAVLKKDRFVITQLKMLKKRK